MTTATKTSREFQVGDLVCALGRTPKNKNGENVNVATVKAVHSLGLTVSFDSVNPTKFWVYEKTRVILLVGVTA